ncbi:MAG: DNA-binding response regulator [Frondihabitans sp.]|nr:DNA-binding response regulator [Frondihabitans sp.]
MINGGQGTGVDVGLWDEGLQPLFSGSAHERVSEVLLDLQRQVPYAASLLTMRRHTHGPDRPIRSYRMTLEQVRDRLGYFIPHSPEIRLVLDAPRELLDWTREPEFQETVIAREHPLTAGFTQGVSFALVHGIRVVGTWHVNFTRKTVFSRRVIQALDAARSDLEEEVAAFVVAGDVGLTRREMDVLNLMGEGLTNAEIGVALHVSRNTVTTHVEHVLHKLHAANRVQAVRAALALALI